MQNGSSLVIQKNGDYDIFDNYCIEYMDDELIMIACFNEEELQRVSILHSFATTLCMFFSSLFLFVTSIIHIIIPKLRNLHGESFAGYSFCLGFGFLLIGLIQIGAIHLDSVGKFPHHFDKCIKND